MTVRLLIVDDSAFFRKRLVEILNATGEIQVVGVASNGREGVDMASRLKPDVITMDYEMPVLNGIAALQQIMKENPTPVLMFSSLTYEGARVTLDALAAGAVDFLPKNFEDVTGDASRITRILRERILSVARNGRQSALASARQSQAIETDREHAQGQSSPASARTDVSAGTHSARPAARQRSAAPTRAGPPQRQNIRPREGAADDGQNGAGGGSASVSRSARMVERLDVDLVMIGTSTGGPVALQRIITQLPGHFPVPVLLVQHMPATFTPAFAERLDRLSTLQVKQATEGETMVAGGVYIAPGGMQTLVEKQGANPRIRIMEGDNRLHYKPCIDVSFGSATKRFGNRLLGIILTGMGADGREGCRMLRQAGAHVWAQDEASSVIYGMPMAVAEAGLAEHILPLESIAPQLVAAVG